MVFMGLSSGNVGWNVNSEREALHYLARFDREGMEDHYLYPHFAAVVVAGCSLAWCYCLERRLYHWN